MIYKVKLYMRDGRDSIIPYFELGFKYKKKGFLNTCKEFSLFNENIYLGEDFYKELTLSLEKYSNITDEELMRMIKNLIIQKENIDIGKVNKKNHENNLVNNLKKKLKTFEIEINED